MLHHARWILIVALLIGAAVGIALWAAPHVSRAPSHSSPAAPASTTSIPKALMKSLVPTPTYRATIDSDGNTVALIPESKITLTLPSAYATTTLTVTPSGALTVGPATSTPAGDWMRTITTQTVGTSTVLVSSADAQLQPFVLNVVTLNSDRVWENGLQLIQKTDANQTVHMVQGQRFAVALGKDLFWKLSFSPKGLVTPIRSLPQADDVQGAFTATDVGTTTLTAVGAPICVKGQMCPQFRITIPVYLTIDPAAQ